MMTMRTCLAVLGLFMGLTSALAHKPSDSHLTLSALDNGRIDVEWHVSLRDLDGELRLDANDDGRLTWGEVRSRWTELLGYARAQLTLSQRDQPCTMVPASDRPPTLASHTDGRYAVMRWQQACAPASGDVRIEYQLFALTDPTHRGIVRWRAQSPGTADRFEEKGITVMGGNRPAHRMALVAPSLPNSPKAANTAGSAPPSGRLKPSEAGIAPSTAETTRHTGLQTLRHFAREGMVHIGSGADHVLFLVSLLLVAVWRRPTHATSEAKVSSAAPGTTWGWAPQHSWRPTLNEVVRLVTAFTVAHSITLGLAAFGVLSPPSRWIESLIAASVVVAALDNLFPLIRAPRWIVVFGFGLIHGFGFAGALQDMGLDGGNLAWPLLGFNLGVELGQLLVVAVLLPPAYLMRRTRAYRYGVVLPASLAIAVLSLIWLIERAGDVVILGWEV